MSDTLTKRQETQVDKYYQKVLKNGIKSGIKTDRKKAEASIRVLYEKYLEVKIPTSIIYVDSPEAAIKIVAKETGKPAKDLIKEIIFINWYTWWVAYYHAGVNILKETKDVEPDLIKDLNEYEALTQTMHAILPCDTACFVIEYPKYICIKNDDLEAFNLHREGGLALEYNDSTGLAFLNGVEVPEYITMTPGKDLDVKQILAETNVDVRREGLRRVSPMRILKDIGAKLLDKSKSIRKGKHWDYELYDTDFKDGKVRRLLKMFDVASKTYTIERVEDTNSTVLEALAFRDGESKYVEPVKRT